MYGCDYQVYYTAKLSVRITFPMECNFIIDTFNHTHLCTRGNANHLKEFAETTWNNCGEFFLDERVARRNHVSLVKRSYKCSGKICRFEITLPRFIEKRRGDAPSGQSFCEQLTTRSCIRCTRCIHTHMQSSRHTLHQRERGNPHHAANTCL